MIWDVVVIGAGPAGLSAALNLARARRSVLVLDSNRPRNSATFASHGYLGHDGISPLQLRSLGREELSAYPDAQFLKTVVSRVESAADGFVVTDKKVQSLAKTVLLATGLLETFPAVPSMRSFYGTRIHSCIACDAYEYADQPIALIGETDDLVARALHLAQWSRDLVVFTNGVASIADFDEERLARRGIRVDRRPIDDFVGDREGFRGIRLADGGFVPRVGAFVRQQWAPALGFASGLGLATDSDALVEVDAGGRTSLAGIYAAGDCTPPGPQQIAVAVGAGATVADAINRDLITLDS